ncbi:hypothetical protein ACA910_002460 [Epithemia clementina (nom. ined.)]
MDFLNGISDPSLTPAKLVVNGDKSQLSDFEQCQQYFQMVISATKTDAMNDDQRKVAAVHTKKKAGNNNKCKGLNNTNNNNKKPKERVCAGHYKIKEWNALSDEEKQQVFNMQQNKKDNKRKVKALSTNPSNSVAPPEKRARFSTNVGGGDVINLTPLDKGTDEVAPSATLGKTPASVTSAETAESDERAKSAASDVTRDQVTVTAPDDLTDKATDGKTFVTKPTTTKFARPTKLPTPLNTPTEYPKTQAGQNYVRFVHKKPATMDSSSVVAAVATTVSYPTYSKWQNGKKQPSKKIPAVPANCTHFEPLDLPIKEVFFHGSKSLPSEEKQLGLKKIYRHEGEMLMYKSVAWSWRWEMMTPNEKSYRLRYYSLKKLLGHTEKFAEAYRLSKEANDLLEQANTTPNKIGKLSRKHNFDVRDPNKKPDGMCLVTT